MLRACWGLEVEAKGRRERGERVCLRLKERKVEGKTKTIKAIDQKLPRSLSLS